MKHKHILLIVLLLVGVASLAWAQTPCLSFDGVNDYVSFGSNSAFNFSSGAATYEAWINWAVTPQNDGTGNGVVFANMVPGSAGQIIIGIHNNRLFCGTTAYQYGLSNASSYITANVWHHWAVVHTISPAHVKLYLDGIEITLTNVANQYNPQGTGFRIGSRASGALAQYFFKGKMDDVRVWNVARTATEIADNYDNELAAPLPASLVGYWKLNESGTTQTASDETGVNNGTLLPAGYVNGPQWDEEGTETLPVELSSFTAVLTAEYFVKLHWTTQSETGVSGFYVYRNTDSDVSHAIAVSPMIDATNTSDVQNYDFIDNELYEAATYYYWLVVQDMDGSVNYNGPTTVYYSTNNNQGTPGIPVISGLQAIYPNPFNANAVISYGLRDASTAVFTIYNTRGQIVRSFSDGQKAAGNWKVFWNGMDNSGKACSIGVYYIKMQAGNDRSIRKAVLIK